MPKRRRANEEEESIETGNVDQGDFSDGDDSGDDEIESNTDKYNVLQEDDIEGQEDPTLEFDGEVQITPFNMQEEMEEGHFDKEGTYIFGKKDKDEVKDHWLDNIDWVKVNSQSAAAKAKIEDDNEKAEVKNFNHITCYKEILAIIQPGETVLKALKRLGGNKIQTASQRWKKKKELAGQSSKSEENGDKERLLKLTELANNILTRMGNMDVYEETYEGIRFKVQQAEATAVQPDKMDADLDMFGEAFNEKTTDDGEPSAKKGRFNEEGAQKEADETQKEDSNNVQWHFKWENTESAEVHGPHSTMEMQQWVEEGYFDPGVWVRRVDQTGDFYTSKRIDFDLYL